MIVLPTTLRFKGEREYLHGTDIYDALIDQCARVGLGEVDGPLDLTFSRFCTGQMDFRFAEYEDDRRRPEDTVGHFNLTTGPATRFGWMVQTTRPVTERCTFDEDAITRRSKIANEIISDGGANDARPIEVVVALTKHLHYTVLPIDSERWILAQLRMSRPLRQLDKGSIEIHLINCTNTRLTKSSLYVGGDQVGEVLFTLVKP